MTWTFNLSLAGYLAALLFATANLLSRERRRFTALTTVVLTASALLQTVWMIARWVAAGRAPFSNMFESLVLFAWALVVVFLGMRFGITGLAVDASREALLKRPASIAWAILGAGTALMAVLILAYASTFEAAIAPLMPALRSNWLTVHVFTCFLAYGAVTIAMLSSIAYLVSTRLYRMKNTDGTADHAARPMTRMLEDVTDKTISFGFLFLTVGIVSGAVWANSAWGTYWSWDPKETWSLVTWFIYAIYLHCRFMRGWRGAPAAWIAVIGFAAVVFTYVGVNFLLSGLHSYAGN
jgi:cytochrome c-type biogenesis protein CcsB